MTTEELFALSLAGEHYDDEPWEAVHVLRLRGKPEVFEVAKRHCNSEDPRARARGLDVLAQLGAGKPNRERPFKGESVTIAIERLKDPDPQVVSSAAWALSHLGTEAGVARLIELQHHPDADVRHAIAFCLDLRNNPEAEQILMNLMEDKDGDVRDWATFALGGLAEFESGEWHYRDSPEIRAALKRRLQDTYEAARREAIWALARLKDPVGLKMLLDCLDSTDCWTGDVDAAAETLGVGYETPIDELREGLKKLLSD